MQSSIEKIEEFEQKDLGSEFEGRDSIDSYYSKDNKEMIRVISRESGQDQQYDATYLFIGGGRELETILKKQNAFNDNQSLLVGRVALVTCDLPEGKDVISFSEVLLSQIEKLSLKRINLIGFYQGANIVQALTILSPRLFRRVVLIDPMARVSPSLKTKIIDFIEKYLPVGLPFRASTKEFDSRPFLHRIRCPVVVLKSPDASFYTQAESDYIASKIPNCYLVSLKEKIIPKNFSDEFLSIVKDFNQSPVKRPQKNL